MNLIGCLTKSVSEEIKNGIRETADYGLTKALEIESRMDGKMSQTDKIMLKMAKDHAKSMKSFADSLTSCEE